MIINIEHEYTCIWNFQMTSKIYNAVQLNDHIWNFLKDHIYEGHKHHIHQLACIFLILWQKLLDFLAFCNCWQTKLLVWFCFRWFCLYDSMIKNFLVMALVVWWFVRMDCAYLNQIDMSLSNWSKCHHQTDTLNVLVLLNCARPSIDHGDGSVANHLGQNLSNEIWMLHWLMLMLCWMLPNSFYRNNLNDLTNNSLQPLIP